MNDMDLYVTFTAAQYDAAIQALKNAKQQLRGEWDHCSICMDSDHDAHECPENPLFAMAVCHEVGSQAVHLPNALLVMEKIHPPGKGE